MSGGACTIRCIARYEAYAKLGSFLVYNCTPGIYSVAVVYFTASPFFSAVAQELGYGELQNKV